MDDRNPLRHAHINTAAAETVARYVLGDVILSNRPHMMHQWPIPFGNLGSAYVLDFISLEDGSAKAFCFKRLRDAEDFITAMFKPPRALRLADADWVYGGER